MKIKILGSGCSKCEKLEKDLVSILSDLGIYYSIEVIESLKEIVSYGVMVTPALVINEKLVFKGSSISKKNLKKIIEDNI